MKAPVLLKEVVIGLELKQPSKHREFQFLECFSAHLLLAENVLGTALFPLDVRAEGICLSVRYWESNCPHGNSCE